jgi:Cu/Zn superoxide dismutase
MRCKNDKKGEGGDAMIKRIVAAVAVGAVVVSGAVSAQAAQGTQATRLSTTERITLRSEGSSMARGTAILTYSLISRETRVALRVTGLSKGVHLSHIHIGSSCVSNGPSKYPLNSLRSMGVRSWDTSTTTVHANVLHKALYINVHGTTSSVLKVVACGALM